MFKKNFNKIILTYYVTLIVVSIGFIGFKLYSISSELEQRVSKLNTQVLAEFVSTSEALAGLVDTTSIKDYTATRVLSNRKRVEEDFFTVAARNPNFYQIRYIDEKGQERVRIQTEQTDPVVVPQEKLENQSSEYYFLDTMKLGKDEFFVSPLELSKEDGVIQEPLTPTISMATPLFKSSGEKMGMVIINYKANKVLDYFCQPQITQCTVSKIYFINSDGYMFVAPNPADQWGFMYSDRQDITFQSFFPKAWQKILGSEHGIFINAEGVFFFEKIFPIRDIQKLQDSSNKPFTYFSRHLSVTDFYMVVLLRAELSAMFAEVFRVYGRHIAVLYGFPVAVGLVVLLSKKGKNQKRS